MYISSTMINLRTSWTSSQMIPYNISAHLRANKISTPHSREFSKLYQNIPKLEKEKKGDRTWTFWQWNKFLGSSRGSQRDSPAVEIQATLFSIGLTVDQIHNILHSNASHKKTPKDMIHIFNEERALWIEEEWSTLLKVNTRDHSQRTGQVNLKDNNLKERNCIINIFCYNTARNYQERQHVRVCLQMRHDCHQWNKWMD